MSSDINSVNQFVGKRIKYYRTLKGMTQKQLGDIFGVGISTVSAWETGVNSLTNDRLFALADVLGVGINDLFPSPFGDAKERKARNDLGYAVGEIVMLPVLGRAACGKGVLAVEDIDGYEPTPKEWLNGGEFFYLRAKGDSMIGARIYDGDLLLVRRQPEVESGDIAVVIIEDEAVLKRVYKNGNQLILQSENSAYPPIFAPPADACIVGRLQRTVIKF